MEKGTNILLSLMQLDIGGAETHVVELAKELKRRGFNVIVTSNGGLYEKELEQDGIKHYTVPLQNKNPFNVIKSIRLLADIIKKEKTLIDGTLKAMTEIGITPKVVPIRGGTDGTEISTIGIPCPNLGAGGHNFHGVHEYVWTFSKEMVRKREKE